MPGSKPACGQRVLHSRAPLFHPGDQSSERGRRSPLSGGDAVCQFLKLLTRNRGARCCESATIGPAAWVAAPKLIVVRKRRPLVLEALAALISCLPCRSEILCRAKWRIHEATSPGSRFTE